MEDALGIILVISVVLGCLLLRLKLDNCDLREKISLLESNNKFLSEKAELFEQELNSVKVINAELSLKITEQEDEKLNLCKKISGLQKNLSDLQSKYNLLKDENKSLSSELDNSKDTNSKLLLELTNLESQLLSLKDEYEKVSKDLQYYRTIHSDSVGLNDGGSTLPIESDTENLDEEQLELYNLMENSSNNMFITGKAGTGKSFLLKTFRKSTHKSIVVLAPTGLAALNVDGATLHSFFGYDNLTTASFQPLSNKAADVIHATDAIIIDEISMVRVDVLDKIDLILQKTRKNNKPFGGIQMIFFGDAFQLPPVATKDEIKLLKEKYSSIFFFSSEAYQKANFHFYELTINHRQQDDEKYYEILNRIRNGTMTQDDIDILNTRVTEKSDMPNRLTTLYPIKKAVQIHNDKELASITELAKEHVYKASIIKNETKKTIASIEKMLPVNLELKLKVGAVVMFVKNGSFWRNGTLGIVSKLSHDSVYVAIDGEEYKVEKEEFAEKEIVLDKKTHTIIFKDSVVVQQYPLILAYAMTIHKSQGKTIPRLACNISRAFASGQVYVALSRCSSLNGLYLHKELSLRDVQVNTDVLNFYLEAQGNKEI